MPVCVPTPNAKRVVRNRAAGSMVKRLGVEEGSVLPKPIVEFYLKNDDLGDPIVTENHIINLNWMSEKELKEVLNQLTYQQLSEDSAGVVENSNKIMQQIPAAVFVG